MGLTNHTIAVQEGKPTYTAKRPCKICNGVLRFTCSYNCVECAKEHRRRWRNDNKEKAYQATVNWRENNKEKYLGTQKRWREEHKETQNAKAREWYKNNPEQVLNTRYIRLFKLTLKEYNDLFKKQNGRCAICGKKEIVKHKNGKIKRLAVDHNHKTKKVRELLCNMCNTGIGRFRDDLKLLGKAIDYIKKHKY